MEFATGIKAAILGSAVMVFGTVLGIVTNYPSTETVSTSVVLLGIILFGFGCVVTIYVTLRDSLKFILHRAS